MELGDMRVSRFYAGQPSADSRTISTVLVRLPRERTSCGRLLAGSESQTGLRKSPDHRVRLQL